MEPGIDDIYLGFLHRRYAFAGQPEILLQALLRQGKITRADLEASIPVGEAIGDETGD